MIILVFVKQVPEMTDVPMQDDYTLDREQDAQILNPADESALEWALAQEGEVTVVSMGPPRAENMLRECLSRGADHAVLLSDPAFAGADSLVTARCLARAAEVLSPFDIISCGRRSLDGETGQVGPMVASLLELPCLPNLVSAERKEAVEGIQLTERGTCRWRCTMPAVLTFCEWSYSLRLPTMQGMRRARKEEITILKAADLSLSPSECGLAASPTRVVRAEMHEPGIRHCRKMSPAELVQTLKLQVPEVME